MQMVLNELSAKFPCDSEIHAREVMQTFLHTYSRTAKIIGNSMILLDQNYNSFLLSQDYRIEQWRNDGQVDRETRRMFGIMLNHSVIYKEEEFASEHEELVCSEFRHEDRSSLGCLIAYESDGVSISFLSDDYWRCPDITGIYSTIDEETGEITEGEVTISNVSCDENVDVFEKYYGENYCKSIRENLSSGADILENKDTWFPNLVFCDNAQRQLKKDIGKVDASQVYSHLADLQRVAEGLEGGFKMESLAHATPESSVTLDEYKDEHTFLLPDGRMELFSWHVRFTGSMAGRIFFLPDEENRKIYIGHIGKKLKSVLYH